MLKTNKFARRPFFVEAVEVTSENMVEIAQWCNGNIAELADGTKYVKVRVHQSRSERQTQAFVGDWVLYATTGYKVYTPKAFEKSFERVDEPPVQIQMSKERADAAGIRPPIETPSVAVEQNDVMDELEALSKE